MENEIQKAKIGILCWEEGQVPKGLMQLETLVGNSTNLASYNYPVRLCHVRGANIHTILENPDTAVLRTMIDDAKAMVADGIKAITTSCGFNAIFQRELAAAVNVPVFASSLLQVPLVRQTQHPASEICILTAKASALRPAHMTSVGIAGTGNHHNRAFGSGLYRELLLLGEAHPGVFKQLFWWLNRQENVVR